jgi:hypothetical protein
MKIDFTVVLKDADDKPVMEGEHPAGIETLLKRAVLADRTPDGGPIPADEKYERFELYMKLRQANSDTDFSSAEVALLEGAVKAYSTLVAGQLLYLLHNKTV